MAKLTLSLILLILPIILCIGTISAVPLKDGATPRLSYIGEINGKRFYTVDMMMNWNLAQAYCADFGMNLAHFDTVDEAYFVSDNSIGATSFWTNGRQREHLNSFQWGPQTDGDEISGDFTFYRLYEPQALFITGAIGWSRLVQSPTHGDPQPNHYPLCILLE